MGDIRKQTCPVTVVLTFIPTQGFSLRSCESVYMLSLSSQRAFSPRATTNVHGILFSSLAGLDDCGSCDRRTRCWNNSTRLLDSWLQMMPLTPSLLSLKEVFFLLRRSRDDLAVLFPRASSFRACHHSIYITSAAWVRACASHLLGLQHWR